MEIFIDSSKFDEIAKWFNQGVVDGVTTNPTIMKNDGVQDVEREITRIMALVGDRPVSVEVTTNDPSEMIEEARRLAGLGPRVVIKVPVINENGESCLGAINTLTNEGVAVNATAILSFNQAILATKAGATYVSIFAGRIADEGNDPRIVIRNVRKWLDEWGYTAKVIVGSIRTVLDIQNSALAHTHVITVPPQFFAKMLDHKYTRETVRQFNRDAEKLRMTVDAKVKAARGY